MRFWLTVSALVLLLPGIAVMTWHVSCQPYGSSSENHAAASNPVSSPAANDNGNQTADHQSRPVEDTPGWCAAVERPDWWALVAVTLTGIAIAYQAREMASTTRVIKQQARYMRQTLNLTKRSLELTERADVHLDKVDMPALGLDAGVLLTMRNYGRTRALNVRTRGSFGITESDIDTRPWSDPSIIAAQGIYRLPFPKLGTFLTPVSIIGIRSGEIPLCFDKEMMYDDVFGKPHKINCSGRFNPVDGTWSVTKNEAD